MVAIATSQSQLDLVYLSSFAVEQYLKICCKILNRESKKTDTDYPFPATSVKLKLS